LVDAYDPDVQNKVIKMAKASGITCHECAKPLQDFSIRVLDDGDMLIRGQCGTPGHPAQFYCFA